MPNMAHNRGKRIVLHFLEENDKKQQESSRNERPTEILTGYKNKTERRFEPMPRTDNMENILLVYNESDHATETAQIAESADKTSLTPDESSTSTERAETGDMTSSSLLVNDIISCDLQEVEVYTTPDTLDQSATLGYAKLSELTPDTVQDARNVYGDTSIGQLYKNPPILEEFTTLNKGMKSQYTPSTVENNTQLYDVSHFDQVFTEMLTTVESDRVENMNKTESENLPKPSVSNEVTSNGTESNENSQELEINEQGEQLAHQENKKGRKRKADPETWNRNIRKRLRASGMEYKDRKGRTMPSKKSTQVNCSKCRFHCSDKISTERRNILCKEYWSLAHPHKQKSFICSLVTEKAIARSRKRDPDSLHQKTKSRIYTLPDDDGQKQRVCLKFFCSSFAISFQVIDLALKFKGEGGTYTGTDRRVGQKPSNATTDEMKTNIKKHIESFPKLQSHYCRKDSRKLYLPANLNVATMYRLYRESCDGKPASLFVYREIFNRFDPQLSFHKPKKDQCSKCNQYYSATDKTAIENEWKVHKENEAESMKMKEDDKRQTIEDNGVSRRAISFDLQAILTVPFAGDAQIYYKRKLSVYNFTIYDCHKPTGGDGHCYLWDETNGAKGASEIGTCLLDYLLRLPESVVQVYSFSDTCGGQNRNKFTSAAMLYCVNKSEHLQVIDMKFMEPGHSYLEADSMHATIESARKHKTVYTTREWSLLIQMARKKPGPYNVKLLAFHNMFDLQSLASQVMLNTNQDSGGQRVNWLKIKWLRFEKKLPFTIQFKYKLSDVTFQEINVMHKGRREITLSWNTIELEKKYLRRLQVSEAKKKDLIYLLQKGIIPPEYKSFIEDIPAAKKARDVVPWEATDEEED